MSHITIDGAIGGGSVLRVAVPIALASQQHITIGNIRKDRKKSGLRTQHLLGLTLLSQLSGASIEGGHIGSSSISFQLGGQEITRDLHVQIPTAASLSLILQALANYALAAKTSLTLKFDGGGTFTQWAPTWDYVNHIIIPYFSKFGLDIACDIEKHGFYPKGGARGTITLSYGTSHAIIHCDDFVIEEFLLISTATKSLQGRKVAERQIQGVKKHFRKEIIGETIHYVEALNPGSACFLAVKSKMGSLKGYSTLGQRGISAENVGKMLVGNFTSEFVENVGVDNFMADQLLVPLAFAPLGSSFTFHKETDHFRTNYSLINQLMGKTLAVEKQGDNLFRVLRI